ncbi:hypothetical protein LVJ94_48985 [Pendulispora rubella]|uniref:Coatomer subunit epsilon n=1 Tax=Pendulispora rubella TaxID=2741070 RepID=A0ABZ2L243_9BACT
MAAARTENIFETVNHRRLLTNARLYLGLLLAHLGNIDMGEEKLRAALADARQDGDMWTSGVATVQLAMTLVDAGNGWANEEASQLLRKLLERPGDKDFRGFANAILANIHLDRGQLDAAESHIRLALDMLITFVTARPYADAARLRILLRSNRIDEAHDDAEEALSRLDRLVGGGFAEVRLRLAAFEAYAAAGDPSAERILEGALDQISIRAGTIDDPVARATFLAKNPINRSALEEGGKRFPITAPACKF